MNHYGFESTDEVQDSSQGLPVGTYLATVVDEQPDEKDGVCRGVVIEWEILDGEHKGTRAKQWLLTLHSNPQTANIAKANIKRIAEATGRAVTPSAPIKGRVLKIVVDRQKKDPNYTEIKKYLSKDEVVAPF